MESLGPEYALLHGAFLVLLDGLSLGTGISKRDAGKLRERCLSFLLQKLRVDGSNLLYSKLSRMGNYGWGEFGTTADVSHSDNEQRGDLFGIVPFYIKKGFGCCEDDGFEFKAPTTHRNALRVLRAMQLPKPVLLEGSPGVGKTSLITALGKSSGHRVVRINLSEQTDMMDLLGSDLPVESDDGMKFSWSDGILLQALKEGCWVLLDELNLAPQSVLEGLNAILDHRAEVFIPELGNTYKCPPSFRVFACQNPSHQGGGRKGLPRSFLNRFTKVYVDELVEEDYLSICESKFSTIPRPLLSKLILFNKRMHEETMLNQKFAKDGFPWEFNLRDVFRCCEMIEGAPKHMEAYSFLNIVYIQRMRTAADRKEVLRLFKEVFEVTPFVNPYPRVQLNSHNLIVGGVTIKRNHVQSYTAPSNQLLILPEICQSLEAAAQCVESQWLCILIGPSCSGKTSLIRLLANLTGNVLNEINLSSATDISELLGSFEQYDALLRELDLVMDTILKLRADDQNKLVSTKFEWVTGLLIRAIERGEWIVLENANLCNPTVLDRINSLVEPCGSITVNERGIIDGNPLVIHPHPNFRMFLTVNPHYGEVSRAMRNRGVEIFMMQPYWVLDDQSGYNDEITEFKDVKRFLILSGIPIAQLIDSMARAHIYAKNEGSELNVHITYHELSHWVHLFMQLVMNGCHPIWSLQLSWEHIYLLSLGVEGEKIINFGKTAYLSLFDLAGHDSLMACPLGLPGGWPVPLRLREYIYYSKEASVKQNCMYLEFLGTQFASHQYQIARRRLTYQQWNAEGQHNFNDESRCFVPVLKSLHILEDEFLKKLVSTPKLVEDQSFDYNIQLYSDLIDNHLKSKKLERFPYSEKSLLWIHGGHPFLPSSSDLHAKHHQLLKLVDTLWPRKRASSNQGMLSSHVDVVASFDHDLRFLVMQVVSNSSFEMAKRSDEDDGIHIVKKLEEMYQVLFKRFEHIKNRLQINTGYKDLSALAESQAACCSFTPEILCQKSVFEGWQDTFPIVDNGSLFWDMELLQELTSVPLDNLEGLHQAVERLSNLLDYALNFSLNFSSRPPQMFSPHQNILWTLNAWPFMDAVNIKIGSFVLEMWFKWHESLWACFPEFVKNFSKIEGFDTICSALPHMLIQPVSASTVFQIT
ncbi:P-loop containing nucleoside triphosphate hydrolase [Sesbania bispinosa]|nr:P-loop containing nucleoside triphosphate hydrolase [Sesbania bispinosa]